MAATAHGSRLSYRADIDGLRAVAVLSVVGYHAFPRWIPGGFIGVDVFFVISGYLISAIILRSLAEERFSFAEFYARRIRRIFPALAVVLVACYAAGWRTLLPAELGQLGKHIAAGAGFIANFVSWSESGYFDRAAAYKPLLHIWSLGIEEQFYALWPLLLWLAWKSRLNGLAVIVAVGTFSFAVNIFYAGSDAIAAFYSPQSRLWELLAGAVLAWRALRGEKDAAGRSRDVQSVAGTVLIAAAAFMLTQQTPFPGWWGTLPVGGAMLVIWAGPQSWLNRTLLANPLMVWVGLISYPLYLWHWPLLSFARILEQGTPAPAVRLALVGVAVTLSWATYRFIERPIRFGRFARAAVPLLAAAMLAIGLAGLYAFTQAGLPSRFPVIVQQIARFTYDHKALYREGTCFLRPEQGFAEFNTCAAENAGSGRPTLLLWGDSHAAHLYPGYRESFGGRFSILQRTASGCPPIIGLVNPVRPHCRAINDRIVEMIQRDRPQRVVLAANWGLYEWAGVEGTIARLRRLGVAQIDLVGPVPQWIDALPRQLYLRFEADGLHRIPERMSSGLKNGFIALDAELAAFSARTRVNYLSPVAVLCNPYGCMTRLGDTGDSLIAWDDQHLTAAGSRFLVSQFAAAASSKPGAQTPAP